MSNSKIINGFSSFSDSALEVKIKAIITKMTGNVNFIAPIPSLLELKEAEKEYSAALVNASRGNTNDTAIKKQKRLLLEKMMYRLALYVELTANENEEILFSSGFDLRKTKGTIGVLPKPENVKVTMGVNPGSVKVKVNKIVGADSYLFQYTETPVTEASNWLIVPSSKTSVSINGLTSGKQYAFKVAGIGSNPTVVFSDIISSYVL